MSIFAFLFSEFPNIDVNIFVTGNPVVGEQIEFMCNATASIEGFLADVLLIWLYNGATVNVSENVSISECLYKPHNVTK